MFRLAVRTSCLTALILLTGCPSTSVNRQDEKNRFLRVSAERLADLQIDPGQPLTMGRCVEIALQNNLAYRVQQLRLSLQDEQTKLALVQGLPSGDGSFSTARRSNSDQMNIGSGSSSGSGSALSMPTDDQTIRGGSIGVVIPVIDWGITYYAYKIAKNRQEQERLAVERTRQTLIRDVRVAYARLAAAQRQERLIRVGLIAAKELLKVSQSQEREGLITPADTAVVEAGLAQAAEEWSSYRRNVEQARLTLAQVMSIPPGTDFCVVQELPDVPGLPTASEIQAYEEASLSRRPELASQDCARRIAAWDIRRQFAGFLPKLQTNASFNWSSDSVLLNPAYYSAGYSVASSLLNGGSQWWNYQMAKKTLPAEEERTLLVSLGILYEVDSRILLLFVAHDNVSARDAVVGARQKALKQVVSRYIQGLETGTDAVSALSNMYYARLQLDVAQTDYQSGIYELQAAALLESPVSAPEPQAHPLPAFKPAPTVANLRQILESVPPTDLRQFPELEGLLNAAPDGNSKK